MKIMVVSIMLVVLLGSLAIPVSAQSFTAANDVIGYGVNKKIIIRLKLHRLECWEKRAGNWKRVTSFPVTHGAWDYPTPKGVFRVYNKEPRAVNTDGTELGSALDFTEGKEGLVLAIHGWDWNPTEQKWGWGSNRITRVRVTQGCVALLRRHMKVVYEWAELDTPVIIRRK